MIECRFNPIKGWPDEPTPSWKRKNSQFKARWSQTLDLLERELNHLRAKDITVEGFFESREIRNDGWPKSSARPSQPGVVLSFKVAKGQMVMPCDTYKDWESNLRAIALTLENLRAVERYGATHTGKQYTGWLRLPAASEADEATQLVTILCKHAAVDTSRAKTLALSKTDVDAIWREAARRTHPDHGGNATDFQTVKEARDRLRLIRGWN